MLLGSTLDEAVSRISHGDHCCLVFSDDREQAAITATFLHAGLQRDERCVFVGGEREVEAMREGLRAQGLDVARALERGRLILTSSRDYLDGGRWSTEKMLGFLQTTYDRALAEKFTGLRAAGDVSWQVGPERDYKDVVYYETLLDMFFIGKRMVGMCEYPRRKCPPEVLGGILNTHKIAAIDSRVCSNVHYMPPELLLEKDPEARQEKRVEWMTSQLVRLRDAEAARAKAQEELETEKKVRDIFGHFVTPEVVNYVLSSPEGQLAESVRKTVTVLFLDARSFTPFARDQAPDAVVGALNELFERVAKPIRDAGGVLNKFMGDGILALFGAPLDMQDHARAAAEAALAIQAAVEELARERQARGQVPLRIGIGIDTGEVVAGCLGTKDRTEYSVIGHTVNLAARLEAAAAPGQILLGPGAEKALDATFDRKSLGRIALKGIAEPVPVAELRGRRSALDCSVPECGKAAASYRGRKPVCAEHFKAPSRPTA